MTGGLYGGVGWGSGEEFGVVVVDMRMMNSAGPIVYLILHSHASSPMTNLIYFVLSRGVELAPEFLFELSHYSHGK